MRVQLFQALVFSIFHWVLPTKAHWSVSFSFYHSLWKKRQWKQSPEIRLMIPKSFWELATVLPTWNGVLTLFMNIKCHQFSLHQIISGDITISVEGEGVFLNVQPSSPSPHTSPSIDHSGSLSTPLSWEENKYTWRCSNFHHKSQIRSLDRDVRYVLNQRGPFARWNR